MSLIPCDRQQRATVLREVQKSVAQRTGTKADYLIPVEPAEITEDGVGFVVSRSSPDEVIVMTTLHTVFKDDQ